MTKSKKEASTDDMELSKKLVDLMLYHSIDECNFFMKMIDNKIKFLNSMLAIEYENEPFKLFKKAHQEWSERVEKLNSDLTECYKKLEEEFQEIQNIHSVINNPE